MHRGAIRWPLVAASSCFGVFLGTAFACVLFILCFIVAGLAFRGGWMAYPAAYIVALVSALVGWLLGAYIPTLLPLILAAEDRMTHWATTFILTTLAGVLLLSGIAALWRIYGPYFANALEPFILPFLVPLPP